MTFTPVSPWSGSPDRTAAVRTFGGARVPMKWPSKDPSDLLDFSAFLHPSVVDLDDSVAGFTLSTFPADLTVEARVVNGKVLTGWLSGGTTGVSYSLVWSFTMHSGRVLVAAGSLPVADLTTNVITKAMLRAAVLALVTDPTGLQPGDVWLDGGVPKQVPGATQTPSTVTVATMRALLLSLPTSPAGLLPGDDYLDGGTLKQVPGATQTPSEAARATFRAALLALPTDPTTPKVLVTGDPWLDGSFIKVVQ